MVFSTYWLSLVWVRHILPPNVTNGGTGFSTSGERYRFVEVPFNGDGVKIVGCTPICGLLGTCTQSMIILFCGV